MTAPWQGPNGDEGRSWPGYAHRLRCGLMRVPNSGDRTSAHTPLAESPALLRASRAWGRGTVGGVRSGTERLRAATRIFGEMPQRRLSTRVLRALPYTSELSSTHEATSGARVRRRTSEETGSARKFSGLGAQARARVFGRLAPCASRRVRAKSVFVSWAARPAAKVFGH